MTRAAIIRWALRILTTCALWLLILRWLYTAQAAVGLFDFVPDSIWSSWRQLAGPLYGSDADPHDVDDDLIGFAMLALSAIVVAGVETTLRRLRRPLETSNG